MGNMKQGGVSVGRMSHKCGNDEFTSVGNMKQGGVSVGRKREEFV